MGVTRNGKKHVGREAEESRSLGRPRPRWTDNINKTLKQG
jgi:hypothetical protein